jgi:hypothetical protein
VLLPFSNILHPLRIKTGSQQHGLHRSAKPHLNDTANTLDKWSSGAFSGFLEQEKRRTRKAHEKLLTGLREVMVGQSWTPPVGSIAERVRKEQALEACAQRLNLLTIASKAVTSFKLSHASSA